jgi:hypothetical protein
MTTPDDAPALPPKARATWARAIARDDDDLARARLRRLASPRRRPRSAPRLAFAFAAAAVITGLAFVHSRPPEGPVVAPPHAPTASAVTSVVETVTATAPTVSARPAVIARIETFESETAIAAGVSLEIALSPESTATLVGPARFVAHGRALQLLRGVANVRARGAIVVEAPGLRVRSHDADFRLVVDDRGARVEELRGEVATERPHPRQIARGGLQTPPIADGPAVFGRAIEEIQRGERAAAEASLRELLGRSTADRALRARASLRLAELLIARGARDDAAKFLSTAAADGDDAIAFDATRLLVRDAPRTSRIAAWERYLEMRPASPRREEATSELEDAKRSE